MGLFATKITPNNTCDTLFLSDYFKYLDTSDALHLTNYYKVKRPRKPSKKQVETWELEFLGELLKRTDNYEIVKRMQTRHKMMKLGIKYNAITLIIGQIIKTGD
jgi:hypothetical protein